MSTARQIASGDVNGTLFDFPGFIAGNWYLPFPITTLATGSAPGANSIRLFPGYIKQTATLNTLGVRIVTGSAGNIQAAIYANNATTGRPTGSALASTASMSTAIAQSVSSAVSIQLTQGLYWFATNCDNASAVPVSISSAAPLMAALYGSATNNISLTAVAGINGVAVSQTFGTWPDLSAASFTELQANTIPVVQFKIASVP